MARSRLWDLARNKPTTFLSLRMICFNGRTIQTVREQIGEPLGNSSEAAPLPERFVAPLRDGSGPN
jgi:hypothetical protein